MEDSSVIRLFCESLLMVNQLLDEAEVAGRSKVQQKERKRCRIRSLLAPAVCFGSFFRSGRLLGSFCADDCRWCNGPSGLPPGLKASSDGWVCDPRSKSLRRSSRGSVFMRCAWKKNEENAAKLDPIFASE